MKKTGFAENRHAPITVPETAQSIGGLHPIVVTINMANHEMNEI